MKTLIHMQGTARSVFAKIAGMMAGNKMTLRDLQERRNNGR